VLNDWRWFDYNVTGGGGARHLIPIVKNLTVHLFGAIETFIVIIAVIDGVFFSWVVLWL
jgi:hypothetical protein